MEDQTRDYIISMTEKTLGIDRKQAGLRLEALLKSDVLVIYNCTSPEATMFQVVVDIAMQIPQINQ